MLLIIPERSIAALNQAELWVCSLCLWLSSSARLCDSQREHHLCLSSSLSLMLCALVFLFYSIFFLFVLPLGSFLSSVCVFNFSPALLSFVLIWFWLKLLHPCTVSPQSFPYTMFIFVICVCLWKKISNSESKSKNYYSKSHKSMEGTAFINRDLVFLCAWYFTRCFQQPLNMMNI